MKKIGILTSGGDCQGLNAAIRGVAKALYKEYGSDLAIYGINNGYSGLIDDDYSIMSESDFSGILTLGGTILGTSRQPFKQIVKQIGNPEDKLENMKRNYAKMGLDCLVVLGGNGTHKTANLLSQNGLNIVSLPKTIDNDIWGTDVTFGFHSAMAVATEVIDRIHTTATSHRRVFIIELMGHKAGWLTLYAGMAGGADIILIPEIPYNADSIINEIKSREARGKGFSILAVAEGAISADEAEMKKKEFKKSREEMKYPSISYRIADEIAQKTGDEIRVTVPGHFQRGGAPCPYDRVLATRFGTAAASLIKKKKYGYMVALKNNNIIPVALSEVAGQLKGVPCDCAEIKSAREIGICFGD